MRQRSIGDNELYHHGIKGQKWGVRRFQNKDGSRTPLGKERDRKKSKYYFRDTDYGTLKKGEVLSRVQRETNFDPYPFYATHKTADQQKYIGLYGVNLIKRQKKEAIEALKKAKRGEGDYEEAKEKMKKANDAIVYQHKLVADADIKIPSTRRAAQITHELVQRPYFKTALKDSISSTLSGKVMVRPSQRHLLKKARIILNRDDVKDMSERDQRTVYGALNLTLTFHNQPDIKVQKAFYRELTKYGYGAISDINDKNYSSYHAKDPLIIFDLNKVKSSSIEQLDNNKIRNLNRVYNVERLAKEVANILPMVRNKRENELYHFGIKGMKWGVRRFQNRDGTRTSAGKKRYNESGSTDREARKAKIKKAAKIAAAVAGTAALGYGAYRLAKSGAAGSAFRKVSGAAKSASDKIRNSRAGQAASSARKSFSKEKVSRALKSPVGIAGAAALGVGLGAGLKTIQKRRRNNQASGLRDDWRKKDSKQITDDELRTRIKRLEMERQYKNLMTSDAESDARKIANTIVSRSAGKVATSLATGVALYGVNKYLNKHGKGELFDKIYEFSTGRKRQ